MKLTTTILAVAVLLAGGNAAQAQHKKQRLEQSQPAPSATTLTSQKPNRTMSMNGNTSLAEALKPKFVTVPNDPIGVQVATLPNGLKIYLSVNKDAPRIQTFIATRAGSKNDPTDATGLAHYLEHMLFKGTSKIGTLDWEKERALLQKISDLYEKRRGVKDDAERVKIYAEIDATSQEAAKFVVANEYDKMMSSLGAQGTNAFTSLERTCYVNDIPSNELEKWMVIESERMHELTLRLFHTELEAVYEEFNIGQDNDGRKVYKTMMESLFPTHTYGTQTTIGTSEHLKNPSMVKIHQFFDKYYVPNNMAVILSGDLDPEKAYALALKYFGKWERKSVSNWEIVPQATIAAPITKEVTGNEKASLQIGYRFDGVAVNLKQALMLDLVGAILNNGEAGLIDLNLLQKQKVLKANAGSWGLHDYSIFMLNGTPREGQTLEEVRDLLLGQIAELQKGSFDTWLIDAAIKNAKLERIKGNEQNRNRTSAMLDAFILEQDWAANVNYFDDMSKITKAEVVAFANKYFAQNYVCVFKRQGEDKSVAKVEKPKITTIPLNRKDESAFQQAFKAMSANRIEPKFLDFKTDIQSSKLPSGVTFDYIKNESNQTFELYYTFDMGKNNDKQLPMAIKLLPYLGTEKYTAEQLKQEFFKLGVTFDVFSNDERTYVTLNGLEESLPEGIKLFEYVLSNVKSDQKALDGLVADIMKQRYDALSDKRGILRSAMVGYAKYGTKSPFTDIIPEADLKALKVEDLTNNIKTLCAFPHNVFYFGSRTMADAQAIVGAAHTAKPTKTLPAETVYPELEITKNKVYFVNFPMVQSEIMMLSKGTKFDLQQKIMADWYNDYFGFGLSSIMFQEIREAKALAYSTFAAYGTPSAADRSHYLQAYVGTQADKLKDAVTSVKAIVEEMPVAAAQIENARQAIIKKIESERIIKSSIYWTYLANKKLGLDSDVRNNAYAKMQSVTQDDLIKFQQKNVKGRNYSYLVLGDKSKVDMEFLKTLGEVEELSLKDIFGYSKP